MNSPDSLEPYRPLLQRHIKKFVGQRRVGGPVWQADTLKRLQAFATGGKLLRGCLVCHSYRLCGGDMTQGSKPELPAAVLNVAAAIEMFHCGMLIHDDIIDQDTLRRGQPAIHQQYRQLAVQRGILAAGLGENLALCAGDTAFFLAYEPLAAACSQAGAATSQDLIKLFTDELVMVCAGQMQDIYLGATPLPPSKKIIYEIMRAKTAGYSAALPLAAGAILAGQPAAQRRRLQALGLAAGIIFQIRDDELGTFGQTASIGKPVGSDIREGKKTLLHYYLWKAANKHERQRLAGIFGNPDAATADINYVRRSLRQRQVPARLREDIARLEQTAFRQIGKLELDRSAKAELKRIVRYCAARKF